MIAKIAGTLSKAKSISITSINSNAKKKWWAELLTLFLINTTILFRKKEFKTAYGHLNLKIIALSNICGKIEPVTLLRRTYKKVLNRFFLIFNLRKLYLIVKSINYIENLVFF